MKRTNAPLRKISTDANGSFREAFGPGFQAGGPSERTLRQISFRPKRRARP